MCQSEKLLSNLPSSMLILPQDLKIEPAELPTSIMQEVKTEPEFTIEAITKQEIYFDDHDKSPIVPKEEVQDPPPLELTIEPTQEPLIKVKPTSILQYSENELGPESGLPPPRILNQDITNFLRGNPLDGRISPTEPADLSSKKPESLTCMPEIDYIKDEGDNVSVFSNSSDPERLEVDMSQVKFCYDFYSAQLY